MQNDRRIAGLSAGAIALLMSMGAAHAQNVPAEMPAAPPPMADAAPIPLFKTVCVSGTARLSKKWASATTYPALPLDAKRALGITGAPPTSPAPADADVPNQVFQISGGDEYLIIPAAQAGAPFADTCAVIWKADALTDATRLTPGSAGLVVSAAAAHGWTVLRSVPAVPPQDGDKPAAQ